MAVEKSAVREGTRWDLRGVIVRVDEVTAKSVIHYPEQGIGDSFVTPIAEFLRHAEDPEAAQYSTLVRRVDRCIVENGERKDLCLEVLAYLLGRLGPPTAPPCGEPVPPAPKPDPAPVVAEPIPVCVSAEPEPIEDCADVLPAVPDEAGAVEVVSMKKRRGDW